MQVNSGPMMRWLLALLVISLAPQVAVAQPGRAAAPAAAPDAWAAYDAAFISLARGQRTVAAAQLRGVVAQFPGHPAALAAQGQLAWLDRPAAPAREGRTMQARAELMLGMTITGALTTASICELVDCDDDRTLAAVLGGSTAAALGVTTLLTRDGVTQGQAQLYNSATTWTSFNAMGINEGFANSEGEAWISLGATGAGLGLGYGLWRTWQPDEGAVALSNTGGLWTALIVLMLHGAADVEPTWPVITVVADLGIIAGAVLSERYPMSRGRTLLIDTGGVLGALFGGLIIAGSDGGEAGFGALAVTTTIGLVAATYLTRDWDADEPDTAPRVHLTPARIADGWGVSLSWY